MMKTDKREQIPGWKSFARSLPECQVSVNLIDLPGVIIR
jgi:hypothetical protein